MNQSPIDFKDEDVMYTTKNIQVRFFYTGDEAAQLVRGPNNNYLVGNFGKLKFTDLEDSGEPKMYTAFRIEMHFISEHLIKGSSSDIEVVVYHSLRDQGFSADKFA